MKNFFSYFTNIKVIAIMMIFGIFVGTAGYVFAQNFGKNIYRPSHLASGTVNVTPNGLANLDEDKARVSYIVSYADIKSSDSSQTAAGLNVLVPKDAMNVGFTLVGTIEKSETPFMTSNGNYVEKSVNINIPLTINAWIMNDSFRIPTAEEIDSGAADLAVVMDKGTVSNSHVYFLPALHSAHPVAVKVEFDIAKNSQESHIPIRAYKPNVCMYEFCDPLGRDFDIDILPEVADIAVGDFDNHGLYLESSKCSVTRNLSRWDKIGVDITPVAFNYVNTFNLHLNPGVQYYGVTSSEDLCDQAVVTIPAK